jgi:adenine-specific DNA-methyltransferase
MGEHAVTHCLPRLEKVIEGEQGGISESVGWKGGGGFKFLRLGEPVFDERGAINPKVRFETLAAFIWLQETGVPSGQRIKSPLLGVHNGTAYYLLYNGILGDKRPEGGNVLTGAVLRAIEEILPHDGPKVVYGESRRLGDERLREAGVTFKHIPYDVRAR